MPLSSVLKKFNSALIKKAFLLLIAAFILAEIVFHPTDVKKHVHPEPYETRIVYVNQPTMPSSMATTDSTADAGNWSIVS